MTARVLNAAQQFMSRAATPPNGSSNWAQQYAMVLRRVVITHAEHAPRSLQRHLGPSELGSPCDRQVAGKMAGLRSTNHVSDPWPSIMGTAGHAWMEGAFGEENNRMGAVRWLTERGVPAHPEHPGHSDLYDCLEQCVTDHKFLGTTTMAKLKANGPSITYLVQLLLYANGYRLLGYPVRRIVIAAWPRTGSSVSGLYIWEMEYVPARDDAHLAAVFQQTAIRKFFAQALAAGQITLMDIPATPHDDVCIWCPFYRPEGSTDRTAVGCPGHAGNREAIVR